MGSVVKTVKHHGMTIVVERVNSGRFGVLYRCRNDYGEPRTEEVAYESAEEALKNEKKEIDDMLDQGGSAKESRVAARVASRVMRRVAGDEWSDENTEAFAREVGFEIKRSGHQVTGVHKNVVKFRYSLGGGVTPITMHLTLMEFGFDESESVNGRITSPENAGFRIPGGWTKTRNAKELWKKAEESIVDIFERAGAGR